MTGPGCPAHSTSTPAPRGGLHPDAQYSALLLTAHASLALAGTQAVRRAELQAENLRRAIDSRDMIGQAKGILMHRRGISADEAFGLLKRTSQELNVKLVYLATTLTARHRELGPPFCPDLLGHRADRGLAGDPQRLHC